MHSKSKVKSLQRCILENNHKRLSKLLAKKASLSLEEDDLSHCLWDAISQHKVQCIKPLLNAGVDPNCHRPDGRTALGLLLDTGGDPVILNDLLQAGASPNISSLGSRQTPLHLACRKGLQVCIRLLLSAEARLDAQDSRGNTALMNAVLGGHVTAVSMLLREGAKVNVSNLENETALHVAANLGKAQIVRELLKFSANPNIKDEKGRTPLFFACKGGYFDILLLLLEAKSDVNAQNLESGKTVLHWAVSNGDAKLVEVLLKKKAEPNVRDNAWQTPFMIALETGRLDIVQLFLRAKCNVTVTDRLFNTPLHIVARDGHHHLVNVLTSAGLDVNLKGAGGITPLMMACYHGHVATVDILLEEGANTDVVDRHRASPLVYAIMSNVDEERINAIMKLLIRANCSVDMQVSALAMTQALGIKTDKKFTLTEGLYSPLELSFVQGKVVPFMLLLQACCTIRNLKMSRLISSVSEQARRGPDWKTPNYLIKCFDREKRSVRPLKELCRRPVLSSLDNKDTSQLPITSHLKRFLDYEDLDHLEASFRIAFRSKRISSDPSPTLQPIEESVRPESQTQFSRSNRMRQTFHGRTSSSSSLAANKPQQQLNITKKTSSSSLSVQQSPKTPTRSSNSPSLSRSFSLRGPKSGVIRANSLRDFSPGSPASTSPGRSQPALGLSGKNSQGSRTNNKQVTSSLRHIAMTSKDQVATRLQVGSPDTGYGSTTSSLADWNSSMTNHNDVHNKPDKNPAHQIKPLSPITKWSTQESLDPSCDETCSDVQTSLPDEGSTRSRQPSVSSNEGTPVKSKIPVPVKSPLVVQNGFFRDDNGVNIHSTPLNSNFKRSRSLRK